MIVSGGQQRVSAIQRALLFKWWLARLIGWETNLVVEISIKEEKRIRIT